MSDYISKQEAIQKVTEVELQDGTFADAKIKIGAIKTLNEKEIIRKAFERVVERLREKGTWKSSISNDMIYSPRKNITVENAIKILKEECGISE